MEDDRKREDTSPAEAGGTRPAPEVDSMTQGSSGRPRVTPDPKAAWRGRGGSGASPGPDSGPAEFTGVGAGSEVEPRTEEDRRHLEAQRAALEGQQGSFASRLSSRPWMIGAIAAAIILVILLIAGF